MTIVNPFLVNVCDENIFKFYKKTYIMCMSNEYKGDRIDFIFNEKLTEEQLDEIPKYFKLIDANIKILYNLQNRERTSIISDKILERIFKGILFEQTELVTIMFDINESMAHLYSHFYNTDENINYFLTGINVLNVCEGRIINKSIENRVINFIDNVLGVSYWTNENNCNINLTELFKTRKISTTRTNHAYFNPTDNCNYVDILTYLKKYKSNYYIDKQDHNNDKIIIDIILNMNNDKILYYILCKLLVSKKYCHIVLNNINVLRKLKSFIERYKLLMKYLWGYGWLSLYIEECIIRKNVNINNRFILTVDVASELPKFQFCTEDIKQNPYNTLLINDYNLKYNNTINIKPITGDKYYGICTYKEFETRMRTFTSTEDKDIFEGVDWNNIAISGSIIPACLMKLNPLARFTERVYYNRYYDKSDVDIMVKCKKYSDFIKKVINIITNVEKNIGMKTTKELCRLVVINITREYLIFNIDKINLALNTEYTVENIDSIVLDNIKDYFYDLYVKTKLEHNEKIKNELNGIEHDINEIYNLTNKNDIRIKLYQKNYEPKVNDETLTTIYENNKITLTMYETFRFKVSAPQIRTLEIFNINKDFIAAVSQFHLPCVRAYYDKNNIYILPSCITAMMTGICVDVKYFCGSRDYIEIINKYTMRGFGIPLNKNEILYSYLYNKNKNNEFTKSNMKDFRKLYYPKIINDKNIKYNKSIEDLKNNSKDLEYRDGIDMYKFNTINKNGSIRKLQSWLIEAFL